MIISEQTGELFAALAKAQSSLETAKKDRSGHGYKYADLAGCIEAAKTPLAENGLAVTQMMGQSGNDATLITLLTHSSGQYIGSEFVMEKAVLQGGAGKNPAQAMGASITYMRRYAFAAIVGLAQEDDDASTVRKKERAEAQGNKPADPMSDAQRQKLMAYYKGQSEEQRLHHATQFFKREILSFNELSKAEASLLIEAWEKHIQGKQNAQ